jgi:hypothetical protein
MENVPVVRPIPVGTTVQKINSVAGEDGHTDGALARVTYVVGPLKLPGHRLHGNYGYFVEWHDLPGVPVFVSGTRIRKVT